MTSKTACLLSHLWFRQLLSSMVHVGNEITIFAVCKGFVVSGSVHWLWLCSKIHCQCWKFIVYVTLRYRFSALPVNFGTQPIYIMSVQNIDEAVRYPLKYKVDLTWPPLSFHDTSIRWAFQYYYESISSCSVSFIGWLSVDCDWSILVITIRLVNHKNFIIDQSS